MGYEAKVILDSVCRGHRLTTMQITFPRIILAEFNTHRVFSRNSASSRAIPVQKRIEAVLAEPFVPDSFDKNQAGMQSAEALADQDSVRAEWLAASKDAALHAERLAASGLHKHWANRLIEFSSWHTAVVSSTEWSNYDALRDHTAAAPEIRRVTRLMKEARAESTPVELKPGEWHLPYVANSDGTIEQRLLNDAIDIAAVAGIEQRLLNDAIDIAAAAGIEAWTSLLRMISVGCAAAVSYNRQEQTAPDKAVGIYRRLRESGHMSPFEHAARAMTDYEYWTLFKQKELVWGELSQAWLWAGEGIGNGADKASPEGNWLHFCGNFQGFVQDRKMIPGESDFGRVGRGV